MTPGQAREYINAFEKLVLRATSVDDVTKRFFFFNGIDKRTRDALIAVEDASLQDIFKMLERLGSSHQQNEMATPVLPRSKEAGVTNGFEEPMDISDRFAITAQHRREEQARRTIRPRPGNQNFSRWQQFPRRQARATTRLGLRRRTSRRQRSVLATACLNGM
ncbi:hypothetical protein CSUI_008671 [Cystoisospora suis]|uniref:Uncharacterized protein n=1 Tax=Cystoisospora suis TaxID=483139 RepID=A0A2C6KM91_9APIC|nr:hypothetical protein CSUI_008671 [Cystoisospora suis]